MIKLRQARLVADCHDLANCQYRTTRRTLVFTIISYNSEVAETETNTVNDLMLVGLGCHISWHLLKVIDREVCDIHTCTLKN